MMFPFSFSLAGLLKDIYEAARCTFHSVEYYVVSNYLNYAAIVQCHVMGEGANE